MICYDPNFARNVPVENAWNFSTNDGLVIDVQYILPINQSGSVSTGN